MQIVMPSTPAQYFHVLRRQVVRRWRKPLVVFTPKSLLRHPAVISPLEDCAQGRFQRVLPDAKTNAAAATRILLCSGKIYYDLLDARDKRQRTDIALVRLEQFYPFPEADLAAVLKAYPQGTPVLWVQEEPENMGAWPYLRYRYGDKLLGKWALQGISRPASASPATGSAGAHKLEQQELINQAFGA
jgi:2-oxoglutarate dehydrogenase E1 component